MNKMEKTVAALYAATRYDSASAISFPQQRTEFASSGLQYTQELDQKRIIYQVLKKVSEVPGGTYYTARTREPTEAIPAKTGGLMSNCMIKVFASLKGEEKTHEMILTRAQRELNMTLFISKVSKEERRDDPCFDGGLACADSLFVDHENIVLVFPKFANVMSLNSFIKKVVREAWLVAETDEQKNFIKVECLKIALKIAHIANRMNTFGIFHGDIQPRNILLSLRRNVKGTKEVSRFFYNKLIRSEDQESPGTIDDVVDVRIINLQSACLQSSQEHFAEVFSIEGLTDLLCDIKSAHYVGRGVYRDPFIDGEMAELVASKKFKQYSEAERIVVIKKFWTRAEIYALATTLFVLFDDVQVDAASVNFDSKTTRAQHGIEGVFRHMHNKKNELRPEYGAILVELETLQTTIENM